MFRRLNRSKQNNDIGPTDESMSEEVRAEDNASAMGNEALIAENLITCLSNEENSRSLSERIENFDQIPGDDLVPSPGANDNLTVETLKNVSRKKANSMKKMDLRRRSKSRRNRIKISQVLRNLLTLSGKRIPGQPQTVSGEPNTE